MQYISDFNFKDKRAIIRVDYNVPLDREQRIIDPKKIDSTFFTINKIIEDGGRVVLISHLGRPKNGYEEEFSMKPIREYLEKAFNEEVKMTAVSDNPALYADKIVILENLRFYIGEEKADLAFAKELAKWGDVYINDAFATAHRKHASTVVLPTLFKEKFAGSLMQKEIENANKILHSPKSPFVLIVGGGKISDKIKPINKLLPLIDTLILGGGAANTFLKAMDVEMGDSLVQDDQMDHIYHILDYAKFKKIKIVLPIDLVVVKKNNDGEFSWPEVVDVDDDIDEGYMALDIGPKTQEKFASVIESAKTILWSGPMGVSENEFFRMGTLSVAKSIEKAVHNGAFSLIGGGDTAAALAEENIANFGFVSTGGSALLEYIADQKLPALVALG